MQTTAHQTTPTSDGNRRKSPLSGLNTAVVHDWLPVYAGAERVLEKIIDVVPQSELYSLIDFLSDEDRKFLNGRTVNTSFIQRMPFARKKYRNYLPFAPLAIEQFDLRDHEMVLSSSYVVAKSVLTSVNQLHVSYVHSPVRYAWDLYFQYLEEGGYHKGLKSGIARMILHYLRTYDAVSSNRVDHFIANSRYVARRIWKTYRRQAEVIYPPVDVDNFALCSDKEDYYITVSRLVPYKRIDLIVKAFNQMPEKELIVIGDGPEFDSISESAGPNVKMLGFQPEDTLTYYLQRARAFVFAAEEDFGIAPIEAQACGTPVIAFGRGGALETVVSGETGVFFSEQSAESIRQAVRRFDKIRELFEPELVRNNALNFSIPRFQSQLTASLERQWHQFQKGGPFETTSEVDRTGRLIATTP